MQYTPDIQKLFLEFMLQDASLYTRVGNIFNPDNFDKKIKRAAEFINEHAKNHNTLPDRVQIKAVASVDLQPIDGINDGHIAWFLDEFTSDYFCF